MQGILEPYSYATIIEAGRLSTSLYSVRGRGAGPRVLRVGGPVLAVSGSAR